MRGKKAPIRQLPQDPKYKSELVTKLINYVMKDGKKKTAMKLVYRAMQIAASKVDQGDPLEVLRQAVANLTPKMEVRPRRIGGANYQVPVPVGERRGKILALRWLVQTVRNKRRSMGKPSYMILAEEIANAYNETGEAYKMKITVEKMAEANKAFAQFKL